MKRIIIVGEGQTEQSFCKDVLQPHFSARQIYIQNPTIKKTQGGIVNWNALKHQIETHLLQDKTAVLSTLIDYYGLYEHHQFPLWKEAKALANKDEAINLMERGMLQSIQPDLQSRFIPYIQLHEFEGLLFSDQTVFEKYFEENDFGDFGYLIKTIADHPNPESINEGAETAPSKRLSRILKGYCSENENMKVVYGPLLANEIGLATIRQKCPRFNHWITRLESI